MTSHRVEEIRKEIYNKNGFHIIRNFIDAKNLLHIRNAWTSDIAFNFDDFKKNQEIVPGTNAYAYFRPTKMDFSFCTHIWNRPYDEILHSFAYKAQIFRNEIEGKALYHGLHEASGKALQYRVCRTVSDGIVVKKHADFFNELRSDPTENHSFDPSRIQLTLLLSDFDIDYRSGGFKLWINQTEPILFGDDVRVCAGDLIAWRYSIPHEVSGVKCLDPKFGFLRVIFPQIDIRKK